MAETAIRTVLADYPITAPIKNGGGAGLDLDFAPVKPVTRAFKGMVREHTYDICEMAIVTYLQARAYGKPIWLVPAVLLARFQHRCIVHNTDNGRLAPRDLAGRTVGVRAYSQTTGAWVRGILANDYAVDLDAIRWLTFEDAHVAEYRDPPSAVRAKEGKTPGQMLLAGEVDAAILGNDLPADDRLMPVIADAKEAGRAWYERHKVVPINHMVVVSEDFLQRNEEAVHRFFSAIEESKLRGSGSEEDGTDMNPLGVEAMRSSLEMIIRYSLQQKLIPHALSVDELFHDATRRLGA